LGDGHIDQLIEIVGLYQIQSFLKFGVQASTEMISFAVVCVCMITRVLAQVVEDLCILHDGAGSLSQI
jgi:short-subunit dehydrogenase